MASKCGLMLLKTNVPLFQNPILNLRGRLLHTSSVYATVQSGRYKITPKRNKPLTYEQAMTPPSISARKSWNSWNTTTLEGGLRSPETALEDLFIRKFVMGTFPTLVASEIIIKRQYNVIRIAALVTFKVSEERLCFLIGYTEEFLGYWLHCIVKMELQVIQSRKDTFFKYI